MEAKTITMYDEATTVAEQDMFFLSKKMEDQSYDSRRVSLGTIRKNMIESSLEYIQDTLNFGDLSSLDEQILQPVIGMTSGEYEISGTKTFLKTPLVTDSAQNALSTIPEDGLVTKKAMRAMVMDQRSFIGSNSEVSCMPRNTDGYTYDRDNLIVLKINGDGYDTSKYQDENNNTAGAYTCKQDGTLVCYGWLADKGQVDPQNCWVGLFGNIINQDVNSGVKIKRFTALQIQPWIVSENSSRAQYVGFTVPVRAGLEIKIMTGFPVNGSNGGFGLGNSLMLVDGSTINTFVGYIIT